MDRSGSKDKFPPMRDFEDEDNERLAEMIRYVYRNLHKRIDEQERSIEEVEGRVDELEEKKTYNQGVEEGRASLVKWTSIIITILVSFTAAIYYLSGHLF